MSWTVVVILICLLLTIFMVWKEFARPNRSRLPLRLIATILAAVALACIALPVSYSSKSLGGLKNGILLTPGFDADSLPVYQNSKLFTTETAIQKANPKFRIMLVTDLGDIPQGKLGIVTLHILGYGLNGNQLKLLNGFPVQFKPGALPTGIIAINWNRNIKAGERLQVQGRFSETAKKITLILKGLNTSLDSAVITANRQQEFALQATPKNTGKATYTLFAIDGRDTIERETIPFEVEAAKPLKVLILATSPDFENRFLKNWLSQHGYSVAVRTAISKQKFSREYLNMDQTNLDRITPALLERFDLIIGDLSSFKLLSGAETGAIEQQMAKKGLGIIVKADSSAKGTSFLADAFPMDRLSDKNQKSLSLNINGQNLPSAKLTLDAVFIKPQANTQPLVTDEQNHIIASSTIYGSGKIVFSTLSNSFNWVLSGNQNDYTSLWSMLIDKAARKTPLAEKWSTSPALPAVDEPVTLTVDGPNTLPLHVRAGNSLVGFKQNSMLPYSWDATYWPDNYGWQQLTQNGLPVYWWYAFKPAEWLSVHAMENISGTHQYSRQNPVKNTAESRFENSIRVPVSKLYFYLLLLVCFTYLWVERKL